MKFIAIKGGGFWNNLPKKEWEPTTVLKNGDLFERS